MAHKGFPRGLLRRPIEDRLTYFKNYTMAHPNLLEVSQRITDAVRDAEAPLIFLFGPTGVGKSTVLLRVSQKMTESLLLDLESDKGRIPIVGIEAMSPEFSNFNWKDFYLRSLHALKEPFIGLSVANYGDTTQKLRMSLERALEHRRPAMFYIDEAQNLGKVASGKKLQDQTDCIKSLANLCAVKFLLVGTYELLLLRNLSAQICRRTVDIHFPRYRAESPQDLMKFRSLLQTFQSHLPVEEACLVDSWDLCYERSLGCVGILKDWLTQTLASVLRQDSVVKTITLSDLERYAPPLDKCVVMIRKICQEEKKLESPIGQRSELQIALGLDVLRAKEEVVEEEVVEEEVVEEEVVKGTQAVKKPRAVGKPSAKRRPIGDGANAG